MTTVLVCILTVLTQLPCPAPLHPVALFTHQNLWSTTQSSPLALTTRVTVWTTYSKATFTDEEVDICRHLLGCLGMEVRGANVQTQCHIAPPLRFLTGKSG